MNNSKLQQSISKLSKKELSEIFPPITRKNFVVRKSWLGRNQIITFVNNKNQNMPSNVRDIVIEKVDLGEVK